MMTLLLLSAMAVYSVAANFSADILGEPDTRKDTWGRAGVAEWRMSFRPPAGHRVRILRAYGDFLCWPRGRVDQGRCAGALFGLMTTAREGSERVWPAADNTMLYLQVATDGQPARAAYDHDVSAGGLLEPDNTLVVRVAVWLNDTEREIHCEPSFVLVYRYEPMEDQ